MSSDVPSDKSSLRLSLRGHWNAEKQQTQQTTSSSPYVLQRSAKDSGAANGSQERFADSKLGSLFSEIVVVTTH